MTQRQASGSLIPSTRLVCRAPKKTKEERSVAERDWRELSHRRIIEVICLNTKGPMTLKDRLGNRYLVNFIFHKPNYFRVFLDPKKDKSEKKFGHILAFLSASLTFVST